LDKTGLFSVIYTAFSSIIFSLILKNIWHFTHKDALLRFMTIRSLNQLLSDLQSHLSGEVISVRAVLEAFHERGFGFFLFMIALAAALPVPAIGLNTIIALPLLILTAQQAMGRAQVWLPEKWKNKEISASKIEGFIGAAQPWIKRLEFFVRPRLSFMTQGVFSNFIGIAGFIMALAVAIPLPLTNTVPAFGIALMAIGVLMRDGLAVIGGMTIGLLWVVALSSFVIIFGTEGFDLMKEFIKGLI